MKYVFKINIYTDGDFSFPYTPKEMIYDGSYQYEFKKTYKDKIHAIEDILEICEFLKEHVSSHRDWVKEYVITCINNFIVYVKESKQTNSSFYASEQMYGNYDGTVFEFYTEEDYIRLGFHVTEEEHQLIKENKNEISSDMIKEVVLNLFKNIKKE